VCDPCSCEWQFTKCGHAHEMTDRFARRFTRPFCAQMIVFYFFSPRITRSVVYGPRPRNTLDLYLPRHHLRDLQDPVPVVIYLTGARGGLGASYTSYVDHPLLGQMWRIDLVGPNLYDCPLMSATRHDAGGAWIIGYKAWGSRWPAASAATASSCAAWTTATSLRRACMTVATCKLHVDHRDIIDFELRNHSHDATLCTSMLMSNTG